MIHVMKKWFCYSDTS